MDVAGKVVYITGGSSGIGLETAKEFASLGAHVAVFARDESRLQTACREIEAYRKTPSQRVAFASMDVADNADVAEKVSRMVRDMGAPDIAVANAGIGYADRFEAIPFEAFDRVMKTNVYGVRNFVAASLPYMKPGSAVVIVSSAAGLMGMYGYTAYGTSKFALVGFAECLRAELKTEGISVVLVCPAEVDTPFIAKEAEHIPMESRVVKSFCGRIHPKRVAAAIAKAAASRRFLVIPGFLANTMYAIHRLTGGCMTRHASDMVISLVRWYTKAGKGRPA